MNTLDRSAIRWRKSSYSTDTGGACVELASPAPHVVVRDSKDPGGPVLVFEASVFAGALRRIKRGAYDLI